MARKRAPKPPGPLEQDRLFFQFMYGFSALAFLAIVALSFWSIFVYIPSSVRASDQIFVYGLAVTAILMCGYFGIVCLGGALAPTNSRWHQLARRTPVEDGGDLGGVLVIIVLSLLFGLFSLGLTLLLRAAAYVVIRIMPKTPDKAFSLWDGVSPSGITPKVIA